MSLDHVDGPGIAWLQSRLMFGIKVGLENTKALCKQLGSPEKATPAIHVVGTNGKGSTALYLAGILKSHGLRVGLFTSPHLVSVRERIRIDDQFIGLDELDEKLIGVRDASVALGLEPTFFESLTLVALTWFQKNNVDVMVLEAGLGGRLDSTNVVDSTLAVLTSIGLEHTEILGSTNEAILKEKLGVLRRGGCLVTHRLDENLDCLAEEICKDLQVHIVTPTDSSIHCVPRNIGHHYIENASLALEAARTFLGEIFDETLAFHAISQSFWPGRMQILPSQGPLRFILDGAHNVHAILALTNNLPGVLQGIKIPCLIAVLTDKDALSMIQELAAFVSTFYCIDGIHPKMQPAVKLQTVCTDVGVNAYAYSGTDGLQTILNKMNDDSPVLITGSLYLVGAAIAELSKHFEELSMFRNLETTRNEYR